MEKEEKVHIERKGSLSRLEGVGKPLTAGKPAWNGSFSGAFRDETKKHRWKRILAWGVDAKASDQ
jgi:hypothetical protein